MSNPKVTNNEGKSIEAECFGHYSEWPCARFQNMNPCVLADRCKNATPKSELDKQERISKYYVTPTGYVKKVKE